MNLLPLVEEQFSSEIKLAYQKKDALYADLVTVRPVPVGDRTYFNRSKAGTPAGKKARFGKIPRNGGSLDRVPCDMETYYAADEIDEQEVSSTSANGMLVIVENAVASMNQLTDDLIMESIVSTSSVIDASTTGMNLATAKKIWQHFMDNWVFRNGEMPIVNVSSNQWNQLMEIEQFYKSSSITANDLPFLFTRAQSGRFWMDMVWRVDPSLPKQSAGVTVCNAFVKSSVGLALGGIDKVRVRETDDDTILYYMRRKLGSVLIDPIGCIKVPCKD